jgi:hypothetical protein
MEKLKIFLAQGLQISLLIEIPCSQIRWTSKVNAVLKLTLNLNHFHFSPHTVPAVYNKLQDIPASFNLWPLLGIGSDALNVWEILWIQSYNSNPVVRNGISTLPLTSLDETLNIVQPKQCRWFKPPNSNWISDAWISIQKQQKYEKKANMTSLEVHNSIVMNLHNSEIGKIPDKDFLNVS